MQQQISTRIVVTVAANGYRLHNLAPWNRLNYFVGLCTIYFVPYTWQFGIGGVEKSVP